jgi:hypothetical protein
MQQLLVDTQLEGKDNVLAWYWLLKTLLVGILTSAFAAWFEDTKLGIWFFKKVDNMLSWTSSKYDIKQLESVNEFYERYPEISDRLDKLEKELGDKK